MNRHLQASGWVEKAAGGEVTVLAAGTVRSYNKERTFYSGAGGYLLGGLSGPITTSVYNTQEGTLIISIFDSATKKLLWRNTATDNLSTVREKNLEKLRSTLAKMFEKFPPR